MGPARIGSVLARWCRFWVSMPLGTACSKLVDPDGADCAAGHRAHAIIYDMCDKRQDKATNRQIDAADRDLMVQVLSLEYQTLRDDVLHRSSGRFQFLGLMTTAAALVASGILGHSVFGVQTWISASLAVGVFAVGLACFMILGQHMARLRARVAEIEKRINALVPAESESSMLLSWESVHQQRTRLQKLIG